MLTKHVQEQTWKWKAVSGQIEQYSLWADRKMAVCVILHGCPHLYCNVVVFVRTTQSFFQTVLGTVWPDAHRRFKKNILSEQNQTQSGGGGGGGGVKNMGGGKK